MSFLLDTDTASAFLRGEAGVFGRFMQHSGGLYISILSVAELYAWVFVTDKPEKREGGLTAMLRDVNILEVDGRIARRTGKIRAGLQRGGVKVPTIDLLIACTALEYNYTVVTHNQKHFSLVPGLRLEDWLVDEAVKRGRD